MFAAEHEVVGHGAAASGLGSYVVRVGCASETVQGLPPFPDSAASFFVFAAPAKPPQT